MIGHLKNVFLNIPTLAILTIITPIILEYICKSLKLRLPTWLYQKSLNKPNITYIIGKIIKSKHEDWAFLILKSGKISIIPKTIVFVNDIKYIQHIIIYLYLKISSRLQDKRWEMIRNFLSNLKFINFFIDFWISDIQI